MRTPLRKTLRARARKRARAWLNLTRHMRSYLIRPWLRAGTLARAWPAAWRMTRRGIMKRRELDRHQLASTVQHLDTVAEDLYDRALQERDVQRRNSLLSQRAGPQWKPAKGSTRAARVTKRIKAEKYEAGQKTVVRIDDGYRCRWPGCDCRARRDRIEVAHVIDKGNGGSSHVSNLICLCVARHQGKPSLHSGDLTITPLTAKGMRGPCAFYQRGGDGVFRLVAREREKFIYERRT